MILQLQLFSESFQVSPRLKLHGDADFDLGAALSPLLQLKGLQSGPEGLYREIFYKLCVLHNARLGEPQASLSGWVQRALLGSRCDHRPPASLQILTHSEW